MAYPRSGSFGMVVDENTSMTMIRTTVFLFFSVATPAAGLLLSACGDSRSPPNPDAPAIAERSAVASSDPGEVAKQAVADFLSIPIVEITLVSVEAKEFGDPSLGCPEPGMAYAQVITPGHRVVVEADGRRFDVRVAGEHGKICRKPADRELPARPDDTRPEHSTPVTSQIEKARTDLAAQLRIDSERISVLDVRPYQIGIAAPGCRPDCEDPADGCGVLIGLLFDGRRYDYHALGDRAIPCPPLSPA